MVGNRGPYDLCTGKRIPENKGVLNTVHMGPGRYELKSFTNEFNGKLCTCTCMYSTCTLYMCVHLKLKTNIILSYIVCIIFIDNKCSIICTSL